MGENEGAGGDRPSHVEGGYGESATNTYSYDPVSAADDVHSVGNLTIISYDPEWGLEATGTIVTYCYGEE